jgi:antitoxin (DNA-binding transcriptional repressor) of toxin-antitoxin stability system
MKTITIRELYQATGRWVRRASAGEVYVTERGRLVAKIVPASPLPAKPFFANPKFTRACQSQTPSRRNRLHAGHQRRAQPRGVLIYFDTSYLVRLYYEISWIANLVRTAWE